MTDKFLKDLEKFGEVAEVGEFDLISLAPSPEMDPDELDRLWRAPVYTVPGPGETEIEVDKTTADRADEMRLAKFRILIDDFFLDTKLGNRLSRITYERRIRQHFQSEKFQTMLEKIESVFEKNSDTFLKFQALPEQYRRDLCYKYALPFNFLDYVDGEKASENVLSLALVIGRLSYSVQEVIQVFSSREAIDISAGVMSRFFMKNYRVIVESDSVAGYSYMFGNVSKNRLLSEKAIRFDESRLADFKAACDYLILKDIEPVYKFESLVKSFKTAGAVVEVPVSALEQAEGFARRMCEKAYWRKKIRKYIAVHQNHIANLLGLVRNSEKNKYVFAAARQNEDTVIEANQKYLSSKYIEIGDDKEKKKLSLLDIAKQSKSARFSQVISMLNGMQHLAEKEGHSCCFITITLPSSFHSSPSKGRNSYDLRLKARDDIKFLMDKWHKVLNLFSKFNLGAYGLRCVEPHRDGCPHLHAVLWFENKEVEVGKANKNGERKKASVRDLLEQKIRKHFDDNERQCEIKNVEDNGQRPSVYVAKYVLKSLCDESLNEDKTYDLTPDEQGEVVSVAAWRRAKQCRLYAFVGLERGSMSKFTDCYKAMKRAEKSDDKLLEAVVGSMKQAVKAVDKLKEYKQENGLLDDIRKADDKQKQLLKQKQGRVNEKWCEAMLRLNCFRFINRRYDEAEAGSPVRAELEGRFFATSNRPSYVYDKKDCEDEEFSSSRNILSRFYKRYLTGAGGLLDIRPVLYEVRKFEAKKESLSVDNCPAV